MFNCAPEGSPLAVGGLDEIVGEVERGGELPQHLDAQSVVGVRRVGCAFVSAHKWWPLERTRNPNRSVFFFCPQNNNRNSTKQKFLQSRTLHIIFFWSTAKFRCFLFIPDTCSKSFSESTYKCTRTQNLTWTWLPLSHKRNFFGAWMWHKTQAWNEMLLRRNLVIAVYHCLCSGVDPGNQSLLVPNNILFPLPPRKRFDHLSFNWLIWPRHFPKVRHGKRNL